MPGEAGVAVVLLVRSGNCSGPFCPQVAVHITRTNRVVQRHVVMEYYCCVVKTGEYNAIVLPVTKLV